MTPTRLDRQQVVGIQSFRAHPAQQYIFDSIVKGHYKYNAVNASRGFGKTRILLHIAEYYAIETGAYVMWCSLSGHLNNELFQQCRERYEQIPGIIRASNKIEKSIALGNKGGKISFKSMERSEGMRGQHPDIIICDEIAFWDEEAYKKVLSGMTKRIDKGRKVIMSSTPAGPQGVWWEIYDGIQQNKSSYIRYNWMHFTWRSNPFMDLAEIEAARQNMPKAIFDQEFEAKFVAPGGAAFSNYKECLQSYELPPGPAMNRRYYMGIDVGQYVDSSAFVVMDDIGRVVDFGEFTSAGLTTLCSRIAGAYLKWMPASGVIERNNQGALLYQAVCEYLEREGISHRWLTAIDTRPENKSEMVHLLYSDFNKKAVTIPAGKGFEIQFDDFKMLGNSSHSIFPRYGAVPGRRDDLVMALILANDLRHKHRNHFNVSNYSII